jgi:mannose-6-phosphate isomerase-like protein (cupin superfamily)
MNKTKKVWGNEIEIVNTKDYCGKLLNLKQGYCCSLHYHKKKDETFYVNTGCIILEVEDSKVLMRPGASFRIKPGTKHRFSGVVDSQIIEFSTHHEDKDSIRLFKSGKMQDSFFLTNKKDINFLIS